MAEVVAEFTVVVAKVIVVRHAVQEAGGGKGDRLAIDRSMEAVVVRRGDKNLWLLFAAHKGEGEQKEYNNTHG